MARPQMDFAKVIDFPNSDFPNFASLDDKIWWKNDQTMTKFDENQWFWVQKYDF